MKKTRSLFLYWPLPACFPPLSPPPLFFFQLFFDPSFIIHFSLLCTVTGIYFAEKHFYLIEDTSSTQPKIQWEEPPPRKQLRKHVFILVVVKKRRTSSLPYLHWLISPNCLPTGSNVPTWFLIKKKQTMYTLLVWPKWKMPTVKYSMKCARKSWQRVLLLLGNILIDMAKLVRTSVSLALPLLKYKTINSHYITTTTTNTTNRYKNNTFTNYWKRNWGSFLFNSNWTEHHLFWRRWIRYNFNSWLVLL